MINAKQIKVGIVIKLGQEFYQVVSYQHVKPGKGPAYMRTKLKNINSQVIIDKTFRSEEKLEVGFVEQKKLIFLYHDNKTYFFMDAGSYEQISLSREKLIDSVEFLKDGQEVIAVICGGRFISIELPNFIFLKVVSTEGGAKGDTVKAVNKSARLETGTTLSVPLFIKEGDVIKIDTRTKRYIARA